MQGLDVAISGPRYAFRMTIILDPVETALAWTSCQVIVMAVGYILSII